MIERHIWWHKLIVTFLLSCAAASFYLYLEMYYVWKNNDILKSDATIINLTAFGTIINPFHSDTNQLETTWHHTMLYTEEIICLVPLFLLLAHLFILLLYCVFSEGMVIFFVVSFFRLVACTICIICLLV